MNDLFELKYVIILLFTDLSFLALFSFNRLSWPSSNHGVRKGPNIGHPSKQCIERRAVPSTASIFASSIENNNSETMSMKEQHGDVVMGGTEDDTSQSEPNTNIANDGAAIHCCIFGTEQMYVFTRLYCTLIKILELASSKVVSEEGASGDGDGDKKGDERSYASFMNKVKDALKSSSTISDRTAFESKCRFYCKDIAYLLTCVPDLVKECVNVLGAVVKEDLFGALYDCSTDKLSNVQEARKRSLDVSNAATYRLQFQRKGEVGFYFCYLPADADLLDQPPLAPESAQPDIGAVAKKRDAAGDDGNDSSENERDVKRFRV